MASFFLKGCRQFSFLSAPVQNRGIGGLYHDARLRLRIGNYLLAEKEWSQCDLLIHNGHVMIMGFVKNKDVYNRIVDFTSKLEGVKKFTNHLSWGENTQQTYGKDMLLTRRLESALFFDAKIHARNFDGLVFNRVAYVVGIAQNLEEKKRVLNHLNALPVRKVEEAIDIAAPAPSLPSKNNQSQNAEKMLEKNWQDDDGVDDIYGK